MDSTDRMQVRDLIEKLKEFDPKARVAISAHLTGVTNGDVAEIITVSKGDDCVVYLGTEKSEALANLDSECNKLEEANEELEKDNKQLTKRLKKVKDFIASI